MRAPFEIGGESVAAGTKKIVDLPLSMMSDHTPATLSVQVRHGRREGPTLFVSAAVHGDEIIGVEIVRRIARLRVLRRISGTLLLVPIVNTFGFIGHSRYLPDRRDLNRSFPGSEKGSLAARLAHLFLSQVVERSDYGIDLHSAAVHRENLPQIRVDLRNARYRALAKSFGAPVILESRHRPGSLRLAAGERDVPVLVFEAGEGLRFNEFAIRVGVNGVLGVMRHIGMIESNRESGGKSNSPIARKSSWSRAIEGGVFRARRKVGEYVEEGDALGLISDPFGEWQAEVNAIAGGLIVGRATLPVVNQGDALFHIAALPKSVVDDARDLGVDATVESDPMLDEDEIY